MVIYSRRKQIFRQSIIEIKITNNLRKKDIDNYNNELRGSGVVPNLKMNSVHETMR